MLDIFRGLRSVLKVNRVEVDDFVSHLHYGVTVLILLAFSAIITAKQYVGNPIECQHSKDFGEKLINTYCWTHATFVVKNAFDPAKIGHNREYPHPGIARERSDTPKDERIVQKYYQWVCFMLFFQAILFYLPRWFWLRWERGKIEALTVGLRLGICLETTKKEQKELLIDYLWNNMGNHKLWALRYLFCQTLNFVNVVGQMFLMDRFFDGEFMTYGTNVLEFLRLDQENRTDPMIYVFPRMTKCHFNAYGPSGSVVNTEALCILPLNVVNEKIYIFLWFWFIGLIILTAISLLCLIIIYGFPFARLIIFHGRFHTIPRKQLKVLFDEYNFGDWLLLYLLGQNIDGRIFRELIMDMLDNMNENTKTETV